ncbi:MAG: hypothetical protein ACLVD9_10120 [Ruminococcus sp.]|uniref:hypothetical protein n=1 Tax=Ruminococcus sp. TaxID=41978 RepID=UPI00399A3701
MRAKTKFVKTVDSLLEKKSLTFSLYSECLFFLLSHLKANAVVFKPPNSKLFGYRQIA